MNGQSSRHEEGVPLEALPPLQDERVRQLGQNVMRKAVRFSRPLLLSGAIMNGLFAAYWVYNEYDSGDYQLMKPERPLATQPSYAPNHLTMLDWNIESEDETHDKALRRFNRQLRPDIVLAQEVTASESKRLMKDFPGYYGIFAVGTNTLATQAFGNMILSRQRPEHIISRSIDGTSLVSSMVGMNFGVIEDTAVDLGHSLNNILNNSPTVDTSLNYTKNALQETRDIVAATFEVLSEGQAIKLRVATTHISGGFLRASQLKFVTNFMKASKKSADLTIDCADFNLKPIARVRRTFNKIGFDTPPKSGEHTKRNGDYCSYAGPGRATLRTLKVRDHAAHMPLLLTITEPTPDLRGWQIRDSRYNTSS